MDKITAQNVVQDLKENRKHRLRNLVNRMKKKLLTTEKGEEYKRKKLISFYKDVS